MEWAGGRESDIVAEPPTLTSAGWRWLVSPPSEADSPDGCRGMTAEEIAMMADEMVRTGAIPSVIEHHIFDRSRM